MSTDLTDADLWEIAQLVGKVGLMDQAIYRAGLAAGRERAIEECASMLERELKGVVSHRARTECAAAIRALKAARDTPASP